jgi:hypothetical protein
MKVKVKGCKSNGVYCSKQQQLLNSHFFKLQTFKPWVHKYAEFPDIDPLKFNPAPAFGPGGSQRRLIFHVSIR